MTTDYKGLPVRKHSAAIRGASADALNGALKVTPLDLRPGDKAYMVLELEANGENFKPMDEGEAWEEVQITKVLRGAFVDPKDALTPLDALNGVSVALEEIRVQETGQERLDLDTKLEDDHHAGLHKHRRKSCPLCQEGRREVAASGARRRKADGDGS